MAKDSPPPAPSASTTTQSTYTLPTTSKGVLKMFLSNIFNTTIFISANFSMLILSNLLQTIWDRNFGKPKDPVLGLTVGFLSVLAFSFGTVAVWSNPDRKKDAPQPSFLLAMGWAFSFVEAVLIAGLISAVGVELVASFVW